MGEESEDDSNNSLTTLKYTLQHTCYNFNLYISIDGPVESIKPEREAPSDEGL